MTDKVQKIREEVVRMHNLLPVMDGDNISVNYADRICTTLEMYIDYLQEEPVSEDLEEAANDYAHDLVHDDVFETFIAGAQWQKEQMINKACMKLKKLMYDNLMFQGRLHREEVIDNFIEDFKKAMEK